MMTRRNREVCSAMERNIVLAGEFGLCPEPFAVLRDEYRRVVIQNAIHIMAEFLLGTALAVVLCLMICDHADAPAALPEETIIQSPNTGEKEPVAWEDPDEEQKTLEAIKAKSNVIEECIITGYCADCTPYAHMNRDEDGRVLTASGQWVWIGSCVATDPSVIPTGSTVVIGDETYIALDAGVKGNHVDILMHHDDAAVAGVRRETVWWCEE